MQHILLAFDSFKGTFSSAEIAHWVQEALPLWARSRCIIQPLADGGEGFVEVFKALPNAVTRKAAVTSPMGERITAEYVLIGHRAALEMSAAAGLPLVKGALRPDLATTFGVGELILAAAAEATDIFLGLGGSATCDGGAGALQALGVELLDAAERPIPLGNLGLAQLASVNFSTLRLPPTLSLTLASDVRNPLLGEHGAIRTFGKQKGVLDADMDTFEARLEHFATVTEQALQRRFRHLAGTGAAGGLGFGMMLLSPFLRTVSLQSGFDIICTLTELEAKIQDSDCVLTGEGKLDQTSFAGKVVGSVVALCRKFQKPCYVVAGQCELSQSELEHLGIEKVFAIFDAAPPALSVAKAQTPERLKTLLAQFPQ
ncbi:MAG: glycerate kinase [Chloroherpetonaceae bacterium]|nr:glycerate kinase [Chloroherpetonaceae bacterium]